MNWRRFVELTVDNCDHCSDPNSRSLSIIFSLLLGVVEGSFSGLFLKWGLVENVKTDAIYDDSFNFCDLVNEASNLCASSIHIFDGDLDGLGCPLTHNLSPRVLIENTDREHFIISWSNSIFLKDLDERIDFGADRVDSFS